MAFVFSPIDRVVPQVGCIAEAKQFHRFTRNPPVSQIIPSRLTGGFICERALPSLGDLFVDLQQGVLEMTALLLAGVVFRLQRDFGPVGEPPHSVGKINVLILLDEGENVTPLMAAETVKNLPMGIYIETRRLLLMKRTQRDKICSGALERQIGANHIHNVIGG